MRRKNRNLQETFSDEKLQINPRFKATLLKNLQSIEKDGTMPKALPQLNFRQITKQKKIVAFGSLALVSLVALSTVAFASRSESLARQTEIREVVALPEDLGSVLGVDKIQLLAENDKPAGTTISGIEIENEHGTVLYKVKFSDGSFRLYDAVTGLAYIKTSDDSAEDNVPANFVAGITLQEARNIAQTQRPGKTITKIELETENGVVVYSVRFSDDGRVDVNANDGSVLRVRDGDDDRNESSDDSNDSSDDSSNSSSDDDNDNSGSSNSNDDEDKNEDRSGSNSGSSNDDDKNDDN